MESRKIIKFSFLTLLILIVFPFLVFASNIIIDGINEIINWVYTFLIIGAVLAIVVGSIMILVSGGDPGKANSGKMIILYALIAVLVAGMARGIVAFISGLESV